MRMSSPFGVALDYGGTFALVTDVNNCNIRRVCLTCSRINVSTFAGVYYADGTGVSATFVTPYALAMSSSGTVALVSDTVPFVVRLIDVLSTGVRTLAGSRTSGLADGIGSEASFTFINGMSMDATGLVALVVHADNNLVRRIDISAALVTTIAGTAGLSGMDNGISTAASFSSPLSVAMSG